MLASIHPEVFQLAVHTAALDHGIDCEGTLLVEGDILDAQGLCLLQIVEAGVAPPSLTVCRGTGYQRLLMFL
jgi:hypothetical protein